VRFAGLIIRRGRVLGGPAVRAAGGGKLSRTWLLLTVVPEGQAILVAMSNDAGAVAAYRANGAGSVWGGRQCTR
jgi:hypothetical protein